MPISNIYQGAGGGGGSVDSINGVSPDAFGNVTLTIDDVAQPTTVVCNDNSTEQIVIGPISDEMYEVIYCLELDVSGRKILGTMILGYDGSIIEDNEYRYRGADISGAEVSGNESGGNLRISVQLSSVGENSKFKYSVRRISQIV